MSLLELKLRGFLPPKNLPVSFLTTNHHMIEKLLSSQHWLRNSLAKRLVTPLMIVSLWWGVALPQDDPGMDSDGDGYSDMQESAEGYDPNNPDNYPGYEYSIDSDNDGYSDYDEGMAGSDPSDPSSYPGSNDSSNMDPSSMDSDSDGYSDEEENMSGSDPNDSSSYPGSMSGDSEPDSDGDGYPDSQEESEGTDPNDSNSYPGSSDGNMPPDDDGDGFSNDDESANGTDPNDSTSYPGSSSNSGDDPSTDNDGDSLVNGDESTYGTDPNDTDTDDDGIDDYSEIFGTMVEYTYEDETGTQTGSIVYTTNPLQADTDGDLLSDGWEVTNGFDPTQASDGNADSDGDGLSSGAEIATHGTNPNASDSDLDGESDGYEVSQGTDPTDQTSRTSLDSDGDVMSDQWEQTHGFDPNNGGDASLDLDGDGLTNFREYLQGTDPTNLDSDNDSYNDYLEWSNGFNPLSAADANVDSDGDSLPDLWELRYGLDRFQNNESGDYDDDGLYDYEEFAGGFNPTTGDTDGDGISDYDEFYGPDPYTIDSDGDGLSDGAEENDHGTDPMLSDTDGDQLSDYAEVHGYEITLESGGNFSTMTVNTDPLVKDSDGDLLEDGFEAYNGFNPEDATDGAADDDGDGLSNSYEVTVSGTNWQNSDSDNDGVSDSVELAEGTDPLDPTSSSHDLDGDLMKDTWEVAQGLDPENPSDASLDGDGDGLTNLEEFQAETNPSNPDSDNDGYGDHFELVNGKNPADPTDATDDGDGDGMPDLWEVSYSLNRSSPADGAGDLDSDGLSNQLEYANGSKPNMADTDQDGLSDYTEVTTDYASVYQFTEATYTSPVDPDGDNDNLPDGLEVMESLNPFDGSDGLEDRDNDGLSNGSEVGIHLTDWKIADTDQDGEDDGYEVTQGTNPLDRISRTSIDSDGDHMSDDWETAHSLDNATAADGPLDPDNDGLSNYGEYLAATDPNDPDSDDDGYADGFEIACGKDPNNPADADDDSDNDGMTDLWEMAFGLDPNDPSDATVDTDGDNLSNLTEYQSSTNPTNMDTDSDGLNDDLELINNSSASDVTFTDSDGDGMSNDWETYYGLDAYDNSDAGAGVATASGQSLDTSIDFDGDGLSNYSEFLAGTNPIVADSDGDGQSDGVEVLNGSDPADGADFAGPDDGEGGDSLAPPVLIRELDSDMDGFSDVQEKEDGSNPFDPKSFVSRLSLEEDADRDGMLDSWEELHGLNPNDKTDAWKDFDYDRLSNAKEYSLSQDSENADAFKPTVDWIFRAIENESNDLEAIQVINQDYSSRQYSGFGDNGRLARVEFHAHESFDEICVRFWDDGAWEEDVLSFGRNIGDFDTSGEICQNAFGLVAFTIGKQDPNLENIWLKAEVRVGIPEVGWFGIGSGEDWKMVRGLSLTDSGYVAGVAILNEPGSPEVIFRWKDGATEVFDIEYDRMDFRGISENGTVIERSHGSNLSNWQRVTNKESVAVSRYGKILEISSPSNNQDPGGMPTQDFDFYLFDDFTSIEGRPIQEGDNILGTHVTLKTCGFERLVTGAGTYSNILSVGSSGVGAEIHSQEYTQGYEDGANDAYLDYIASEDYSSYSQYHQTGNDGSFHEDFIIGYSAGYDEQLNGSTEDSLENQASDGDGDGFYDETEVLAQTDPEDEFSFPGSDYNVYLSDVNRYGDFVGWIFGGTGFTNSEEYSTAGDSTGTNMGPGKVGYFWRHDGLALEGFSEQSKFHLINNAGEMVITGYSLEVNGYTDYWFDSDGDGVEENYPFVSSRSLAGTTGMLVPINDADDNGLPDDWELFYGVNNPVEDSDNDGLTNVQEYYFGTNPNSEDTDSDRLKDSDEVENGLDPLSHPDEVEISFSSAEGIEGITIESALGEGGVVARHLPVSWQVSSFIENDSGRYYLSKVLANDQVIYNPSFTHLEEQIEQYITTGHYEFQHDFVANIHTTFELVWTKDTDLDLMPDEWEIDNNLNPLDASDAGSFEVSGNLLPVLIDPDRDRLANLAEYQAQTNPVFFDSDRDGQDDGFEVFYGSNPLDSNQSFEGLIDNPMGSGYLIEVLRTIDSRPAFHSSLSEVDDADRDGILDSWEVDNGLDPTIAEDAWRDYDYDRIINRVEYELGTSAVSNWIPTLIGGAPQFVESPSVAGGIELVSRRGITSSGGLYRVTRGALTLRVERWKEDRWSLFGSLGTGGVMPEATQVCVNEQGLIAAVVKLADSNSSEVRIRKLNGEVVLLGKGRGWVDIDLLPVTESGFVSGNLTNDLDQKFVFRWRSDHLEIFESVHTAMGISERGEMINPLGGVYRTGRWNSGESTPLAISRYGNLWTGQLSESVNMIKTNQMGDRLIGLTNSSNLSGFQFFSGPEFYQSNQSQPHFATDLNESGATVGWAGSASDSTGFYWRHNALIDLPSSLTQAKYWRITNSGLVLATHLNLDGNAQWSLLAPTNDLNSNRLPDDWESLFGVYDPDSDHDGDTLSAKLEYALGTNPLCRDTDQDGVDDSVELRQGRNPLLPESPEEDVDGDGLNWAEEFFAETDPINHDSDGDLMHDGWELINQLDPNQSEDALLDFDNDGLFNVDEFVHGTNPAKSDSDDDGMTDSWEIRYGLNPLLSSDSQADSDGDLLSNLLEFELGTNPNSVDSDADTFPDWIEHQKGSSPVDLASTPAVDFLVGSGLAYSSLESAFDDVTEDGQIIRIVGEVESGGVDLSSLTYSVLIHGDNYGDSEVISNGSGAVFSIGDLSVPQFVNGITISHADNMDGGALKVDPGGHIVMTNTLVRQNSITGTDNGIVAVDTAYARLENVILCQNQIGEGGAAFNVTESSLELVHVTVTNNNYSASDPNIFSIEGSEVTLTNSVVWNEAIDVFGGWIDPSLSSISLSGVVLSRLGEVENIEIRSLDYRSDPPNLTPLGMLTAQSAEIEVPGVGIRSSINGVLRANSEPCDSGADEFLDSDGDGVPDWFELRYGLDPDNPLDAFQFLPNGETLSSAFHNGSLPDRTTHPFDRDRDGLFDSEESQFGADPDYPDHPAVQLEIIE